MHVYTMLLLPPAQLGDDDGDGPAGQLHQRPQEVRLVHVALAQVAGVLHVAVVAHEPHHADMRSGFNFNNHNLIL